MSVYLWYKKTVGTFNDYIWLNIPSSLEPGRYRICGQWFCDTTGGISDTIRHGFVFCYSNVNVDLYYSSSWKIVSTYLVYNWFADIYIKRSSVNDFVLHPIPGISTNDLKMSEVLVSLGFNRCVVGSNNYVYLRQAVNDPYDTYLKDASLASLV